MQADNVAASKLIMNASLLDPKQTSVNECKRIQVIRTHTHTEPEQQVQRRTEEEPHWLIRDSSSSQTPG